MYRLPKHGINSALIIILNILKYTHVFNKTNIIVLFLYYFALSFRINRRCVTNIDILSPINLPDNFMFMVFQAI